MASGCARHKPRDIQANDAHRSCRRSWRLISPGEGRHSRPHLLTCSFASGRLSGGPATRVTCGADGHGLASRSARKWSSSSNSALMTCCSWSAESPRPVPSIRAVPSIRKRKMTHLTRPGVTAVLVSLIHQPVPPAAQTWTTMAQRMLVVPLQEPFQASEGGSTNEHPRPLRYLGPVLSLTHAVDVHPPIFSRRGPATGPATSTASDNAVRRYALRRQATATNDGAHCRTETRRSAVRDRPWPPQPSPKPGTDCSPAPACALPPTRRTLAGYRPNLRGSFVITRDDEIGLVRPAEVGGPRYRWYRFGRPAWRGGLGCWERWERPRRTATSGDSSIRQASEAVCAKSLRAHATCRATPRRTGSC